MIQSAEKATGEPQAALIEKAYELIRNICEVIVEAGAAPGRDTASSAKGHDDEAAQDKFRRTPERPSPLSIPLYEDCCRYIGSHSQPLETLNVRPTLDTLKADWKSGSWTHETHYIKKPAVK